MTLGQVAAITLLAVWILIFIIAMAKACGAMCSKTFCLGSNANPWASHSLCERHEQERQQAIVDKFRENNR